ncbi:MAG: hypothetical protein JO112_15460 [Planctomycetes bacterium]|nr:hypothetical protein [Planctomycetota bacterium]
MAPQPITLNYLEPLHFRPVVMPVRTFEELYRLLLEVPKSKHGAPGIGVHLRDQEGNVLSIGLTEGGWLVLFDDAKHTLMAFSVGDRNAVGEITVRFHQQEQLPRRHLLPVEDALQAVRCWLETGKLSDTVTWEMQPY